MSKILLKYAVDFISSHYEQVNKKLRKILCVFKSWFNKQRLQFYKYFYRISYNGLSKTEKLIIYLLFSGILIVLFTIFFEPIQKITLSYIQNEDLLLNNLILSLGIGLITILGISFSLAIFGLQINIERLPHRLFQKIGTQKTNFSFFVVIFLLCLGMTFSSLFTNKGNAFYMVSSVFALAILIFGILVYASQRIFKGTSPIYHLDSSFENMQKSIRIHLNYFKKLSENGKNPEAHSSDPKNNSQDNPLSFFIQNLPEVKQEINNLIFIAERYADLKDYDVSDHALNEVLIKMMELYVKEKSIFFIEDPFRTTPSSLSQDEIINYTLERLRQLLQRAFLKKDEELVNQILKTLSSLVETYSKIEYKSTIPLKSHANLARYYLSDGVKLALTNELRESAYIGIRCLGKAACILNQTSIIGGEITIKDIREITLSGLKNKQTYPVSIEGVRQLSYLTKNIITGDRSNIRNIAKNIKEELSTIFIFTVQTLIIKKEPDSIRDIVAPYYSSTYDSSFIYWLISIKNKLTDPENSDDEAKRKIATGLNEWINADEQFEHEKTLLSYSIKCQLDIIDDVIYWTTKLINIFLELSLSPTAPFMRKLEEKAVRLLQVFLQSITEKPSKPQEDQTNKYHFLENHGMTMILFELAFYSIRTMSPGFEKKAEEAIVRWGFSAGQYQIQIFEKSIYVLTALTLKNGGDKKINEIKEILSKRLSENGINKDELEKVNNNLRAFSSNHIENLFPLSTLPKGTLKKILEEDIEKTQSVLQEISKLFS